MDLTADLFDTLFFDTLDERTAKLEEAQTRAGDGEGNLLCAACGSRISSNAERIAVAGGHEHEFPNPTGILYRIGCFSDASGCRQVGESTFEWSWFAGFAWRIALCRHCGTHMGWGYGGETTFYGLILDRLIPEAGTG